jgi:hypothetical protein
MNEFFRKIRRHKINEKGEIILFLFSRIFNIISLQFNKLDVIYEQKLGFELCSGQYNTIWLVFN